MNGRQRARTALLAVVVVVNVVLVLVFVGAGTSFSLQRQALRADFRDRCAQALATRAGLGAYGDEVSVGPLRFDGHGVVRGTYRVRPSRGYPRDHYPDRLSGHVRCTLAAPENKDLTVAAVEVQP